jgi:hypothetical protein
MIIIYTILTILALPLILEMIVAFLFFVFAVLFFGLDDLSSGFAERIPTNSDINLYKVCFSLKT